MTSPETAPETPPASEAAADAVGAPADVVADAAAHAAVDAAGADPSVPAPRTRRPLALVAASFVWEWAKSIAAAFLVFVLARAFLFEMFKIPSGSMEGTLLVGDFLIVNKMLYGAEVPLIKERLPAVREPRIGDVIVFQWPDDPTKNFVKRLVGVPTDTLEMKQGVLYRNGIAQRERYASHRDLQFDPAAEDFRWQRDFVVSTVDVRRYHPSRNNWGPLVVPARHYFTLGDNRDNSLDSRYWGFVPDSLVRGSPVLVYFSYSPDSAESFDWIKRIRWQRLGERIH